MENELHVFEEGSYLFWGLVILICTAGGTYLLAGSFISMHWDWFKVEQLAALGLFLISFRGIFKISDPLYHFTLYFEGDMLIIRTKKGELEIGTCRIPVNEITSLKFASHFPKKPYEALFDFSTSYHLLYRTRAEDRFIKLLNVDSASITLKVDDIADIMRFISNRNHAIFIPPEQAEYFNL